MPLPVTTVILMVAISCAILGWPIAVAVLATAALMNEALRAASKYEPKVKSEDDDA